MARDYAVVVPRFWTGDTGRRLRGHLEAQVVASYLMTGPQANMIGLYYLPVPTLAHETGLTIEGASKALRRLSEEGFAHYDEGQEVVWVPEMGRHQAGESMKPTDKRVSGAVREAVQYRKSRFYREFVDRYRGPWSLPSMPECEAMEPEPEAPSKALRSQDQDQEHDQEQERPSDATSASPESPGPEEDTGPAESDPVKANTGGGGKGLAAPDGATETAAADGRTSPRRTGASKQADPRAREKRATWERLFAAERGEPYRWLGAADQIAANALAPVDAAVFEARALKGLRATGYPRCGSLAQLKSKWNDLAGATGPPGKPSVTAPANDRSQFKGGRREL